MREQPWHLRRASAHHQLWFENLAERQILTREWLNELRLERPSHALSPTASAEVRQMVARLEEAADLVLNRESIQSRHLQLEDLLEADHPDVWLGRLQHSVETLQGWTLSSILEHSQETERASIRGQLEQAAWRCGRDAAQIRRANQPPPAADDLRELVSCTHNLPMKEGVTPSPFLIERSLRDEVLLELLQCPHRSRNGAVLAVADDLCHLQEFWIRGHIHVLNPRARIQREATSSTTERCRMRWWLRQEPA